MNALLITTAVYVAGIYCVLMVGMFMWFEAESQEERRRAARIILLVWAWPVLLGVGALQLFAVLLEAATAPRD